MYPLTRIKVLVLRMASNFRKPFTMTWRKLWGLERTARVKVCKVGAPQTASFSWNSNIPHFYVVV